MFSPARLLQSLVPLLVPQNRDADELVRGHEGLTHQDGVVLTDLGKDLVSGRATEGVGRLGGHSQGVHKGLKW